MTNASKPGSRHIRERPHWRFQTDDSVLCGNWAGHSRAFKAHSFCLGGVSSCASSFYGERIVPDFSYLWYNRGYDIDSIGKNVRTLLESFVTGGVQAILRELPAGPRYLSRERGVFNAEGWPKIGLSMTSVFQLVGLC